MLELSPELMAGVALAIFWIHVLLVAGAAWLDLRDLLRLRRALAPQRGSGSGAHGLFTATVRSGAGPDGVFACNTVEQVGRSKGDGNILFSDAAHHSELFGGELELADGTVVRVEAGPAQVWPDLEERAALAAPASLAAIAEHIPQARRGKGYRREVEIRLSPGRSLWIAGRVVEGPQGPVLIAQGIEQGIEQGIAADAGVLIAALEPRAWLTQRAWIIAGFIAAELLLAAACSFAALWPPMFGLVSMLGATAALGFFLGVQPLAVRLNEAVRTPDRAYLRGRWRS